MVNFDLRSKVFINRILREETLLEAKSEVPNSIEDKLFADLFTMTSKELLSQEENAENDKNIDFQGGRLAGIIGSSQGSMQIYTSQFLKIVIKIL